VSRWTRFLNAIGAMAFVLGLILAVFGIPLLLAAVQIKCMAVDREPEGHG